LEQRSKEFEIAEIYNSLDEILKSEIEAIVIITQHWLHAPQSIKVLNAGKHVYSAVPTARTLEQCDELVDTVKKTGCIYMLGETTVFRPECVFCKKKEGEGIFGKFVYCEGEYFHDISHGLIRVWQERRKNEWKHNTGEPPFWYPTHSVSGPVYITGAHMTEVSAFGYIDTENDSLYRKDTATGNLFSNEVALFKMSNGAIARICEFRRIGHPGAPKFRIFGTKGSFEWDVSGCRICTVDGWEKAKTESHYEPLPEPLASDLGGHGGSHAYMVNEFVTCVAENKLPRTNVWQAVRYCAPGIVAHQSALKDGELLKIPDWGDPLLK